MMPITKVHHIIRYIIQMSYTSRKGTSLMRSVGQHGYSIIRDWKIKDHSAQVPSLAESAGERGRHFS